MLDRLLDEAESLPVDGWDFTRLGERIRTLPRPWDFDALVEAQARDASSLLDLGTGGGEWLSSLAHLPSRTVATESWPPNVPVARRRLEALGVEVVQTEPPPDNVDQRGPLPSLPFAAASFDVVCSRHESYVPAEVERVLAPGGVFLTQQTGGDYGDFHELLGLPRPEPSQWTLAFAAGQLAQAGLRLVDGGEAREETVFADAGALAWYLRAIPWVVPGLDVARERERLRAAHDRMPATVTMPTFWLRAER